MRLKSSFCIKNPQVFTYLLSAPLGRGFFPLPAAVKGWATGISCLGNTVLNKIRYLTLYMERCLFPSSALQIPFLALGVSNSA